MFASTKEKQLLNLALGRAQSWLQWNKYLVVLKRRSVGEPGVRECPLCFDIAHQGRSQSNPSNKVSFCSLTCLVTEIYHSVMSVACKEN